MSYTVESTGAFEKEFSRNHKSKKEVLLREPIILQQQPHNRIPLRSKLHGLWQLRIFPFMIWYEISELISTLTLRPILHKDEAKKFY